MQILNGELDISKRRQLFIMSFGILILTFYCCWFLWNISGFILDDCRLWIKEVIA